MEKSRDLGNEVRDRGRAAYSINHNKGKEPLILFDVDTLADDELSLGSSPSLSLSSTKNAQESAKAKSRKRPLRHPAFSDAISGTSRRARKEISKRQNQPIQAYGNCQCCSKVQCHRHCRQTRCHRCHMYIFSLIQDQRSTYRQQPQFIDSMTCSLHP